MRVLLFLVLGVFSSWAWANPVVLYDGSNGELPTQQGWLYLTDPFFGATATGTPAPGGEGVLLETPVAEMAGYFNTFLPQMPVLPAIGGFALEFSIKLLSETHQSDDRAGFSVIVLDDQSMGIELGFWENSLWAQDDDPLFTHAETASFAQAPMNYRLSFSDTGYRLEGDGTLLLEGELRDYSAHPSAVYSSRNFLFFGDDTSSAGAEVEIYRIAFIPATVAEPPLALLLCVAATGLWRRFRDPETDGFEGSG